MKVVEESKEIVIALAGNPNSGKTTIFNELTGSRQHVGNWPGVTVERKEGVVRKDGYTFRVVDLPGIYSLSAYTQEEIVARDFLLDNHVDVIVDIVDAGNLERNLYLTTQLLELGISTVVVLNMLDMATSQGQDINVKLFSEFIGAPVATAVAQRGEGVKDILDQALAAALCSECEAPRSARHNPEIEHEIAKLEHKLRLKPECPVPVRWLLIKALEGDKEARKRLSDVSVDTEAAVSEINNTRRHIEQVFGDDVEAIIADGRYGFIGGLLREVVFRTPTANRLDLTQNIDNVILNRVLGIPIFLALMWLTFKLTFDVGGIFSEWIRMGVNLLSAWLTVTLPAGPLSSLIVKGIVNGVGSVIVFLPNIIVIFVIISFLEDSGYMARAAFLMDKSMHALGLHGKSFIPMIMGFGCNVPAVMATRTLDTREDRLITILINPLMSCTARLPIYILFTGVFFSKHGAMVIFSIYALGVLLAVASGKFFRRVLFPKSVSPFVMELPPYRLPTLKGTVIHVWERASQFLSKAGTLILAASVVIWALGSLPVGVEFGGKGSLVYYIGQAIEPIVRPLGLDWKAGVALLFGVGAKEIVVSTIGVLYGFAGRSSGAQKIAIANAFTPLTAYTFMVISLIYVPCIATIAAIKRETNSWKWTLLAVGYSLVLAYVMGLLVYHIGLLAGMR